MTAVPGLPTLNRMRGRRARLFPVTLMLLGAAVAGIVVANWALFFFAGLAAVVVLVFLLCRLDLMVAVLSADFFFNAYINRGAGILTIDKCIGALAVAAWLLDWVVNRRPIIGSRQLWLIGAFLLWTAVALAGAINQKAALVTSLRYLTFAMLSFWSSSRCAVTSAEPTSSSSCYWPPRRWLALSG